MDNILYLKTRKNISFLCYKKIIKRKVTKDNKGFDKICYKFCIFGQKSSHITQNTENMVGRLPIQSAWIMKCIINNEFSFLSFQYNLLYLLITKRRKMPSNRNYLWLFRVFFQASSSSLSHWIFIYTTLVFSPSCMRIYKLSPSHPDLHRFHPSPRAAGTIHIQRGRGHWISLPTLDSAMHTNKSTHIQNKIDRQLSHGFNMFAGISQD